MALLNGWLATSGIFGSQDSGVTGKCRCGRYWSSAVRASGDIALLDHLAQRA